MGEHMAPRQRLRSLKRFGALYCFEAEDLGGLRVD